MSASSGVLQRAALPLTMGVWAIVMVVMGLLLLLEFPPRFGPMGGVWGTRIMLAAGATSLAMGEFMMVVVGRRVFPGASAWLAGAMEVLPWLALGAAAIVGVVLWTQ